MAVKKYLWPTLTDGEQSVILALSGIAFFGAIVAFIVVNQLGGGNEIIRSLSYYDYWIICCGAIGAPAGALLARDWFGHPGLRGLARAATGALIVSFLASIIAGTLALPFYGTMFGPFSLVVTMLGAPLLAVIWISMLLGAHFLVAAWRRERETIFEPRNGRAVAQS